MIYFDNGATSFPKPPGMIAAMSRCMSDYCGNPGRSGHDMSMRTGEEIHRARMSLAKIFNIDRPERVVFTINATEALNIGIKGMLNDGDHVITTAMEHNSVLRPLKALEDSGVTHSIVRCAPDGCVDLKAIQDALKPNTKMIVCTHASNVVGTIMPIHEIGQFAKSKNLIFMVDAAQSAGCVPIDVDEMNIDLLAVPGHKGLLGPLGTGALFMRDGLAPRPLKEGGTGTESKNRRQPSELPESYESGTVNAPGIVGLRFSTDFVRNLGVETIRDYEERLIKPLDQSLRNMRGVTVYGPSDCSQKTAMVTFNIDNKSCEEVAQILNSEFKIAVRAGYHCAGLAHKTIGTWDTGAIRLSVSPFNSKKEIKAAINAIYKISKR
ncbi:MAG: aminotransferase class V-fold PLP-dependent enzyme [Clostridiales bacterium]|nr:aminotransferase class V-fold PLP-dependent enzyme [Clostridiales bacterium]